MLVSLLRASIFTYYPSRSLTCYRSYDFFKAELLKTKYFDDNIICHFAASFGAVSNHAISFLSRFKNGLMMQGTVATTVCSPADVLKVSFIFFFLLHYI